MTLILLFHPDPPRSRVNAALASAASGLRDVRIADMTALYPQGIEMDRDGEREAARLLAAERIVLQFPMQWYSTPAVMKDWQDKVLTRMAYIHPDTEGAGLSGTPVMIVVTMGAAAATYRREGRNRFTVAELLAPLRATMNRCAMDWRDTFLLHGTACMDAAALADAGRNYRDALSRFAASPSVAGAA
ncbi:NAD(P)H-dependent oxidoreductase [Falsiroseomonas sp. E2-1-a20]|uniref:NAD(P)H-dependent oxidoreductase n=1 Tax=Falsiroseomonas sp. E2-1-a20 TaxID=3239300 RepID=UPI003F3B960F